MTRLWRSFCGRARVSLLVSRAGSTGRATENRSSLTVDMFQREASGVCGLATATATISTKIGNKIRFIIVCRFPIGRTGLIGPGSNGRRLSILAPNASQSIAYLTDGRVSLDTREYVRQEIFIGLRRLFKPAQRRGGEIPIATRAQRTHTFHLRLFERRIDPQHTHLLFLVDLKAIDANHNLFLRLNTFLITIC